MTKSESGKLITLSTAFDTRPKILHMFYFIILFVTGTMSLRFVLENSDKISAWIISGLFGSLTYTGAYRFANKAVIREQLLVTKDSLALIRKEIFRSTKRVFAIEKISHFRHLAKPQLTKHPLAGEGFDYLGFQTDQRVINDMHGDKQLAFNYAGRTIKFGNNIPSWDFEELEFIILEITGRDVTIAYNEEDFFTE